MRRQQNGGSGRGSLADQTVDQIAALLIEAGVRLVEKPQPRPANNHRSKSGAATLTGRQVAHGHVSETVGHAESIEGSVDCIDVDARRPRPEPEVFLDTQVVVERGVVTEQTDRAANRGAMADDVVLEDECTARLNPLEPGANPQQCRLAGSVRALQQDDLSRTDVEIDSGESRKPAQQGDDAIEGDDGHRSRLPGLPRARACRRRSYLQ